MSDKTLPVYKLIDNSSKPVQTTDLSSSILLCVSSKESKENKLLSTSYIVAENFFIMKRPSLIDDWIAVKIIEQNSPDYLTSFSSIKIRYGLKDNEIGYL